MGQGALNHAEVAPVFLFQRGVVDVEGDALFSQA